MMVSCGAQQARSRTARGESETLGFQIVQDSAVLLDVYVLNLLVSFYMGIKYLFAQY